MSYRYLENAFLLTNNPQRDCFFGDILIQENRIQKIIRKNSGFELEKFCQTQSIDSKKVEKINLEGKILIPGFVQTHVHLCQTLFRNLADDLELLDWLSQKIWPLEAKHNANSMIASAKIGISELLASGTTTILDMASVHHTDSVFAAAEELGIRAFIGKCMMDESNMPQGLQESTKDSIQESLQLIQDWHGKANDRLRYAFAPRFVLSCTKQLLQEVRDIAEDQNLLIHTHASENKSEIEQVRKLHNCENIEYFEQLKLTNKNLVLAHCIHLTDKEKNILSKSQSKIAHCPSSNLKLASGIADIVDLRKHSICVSLGADGAPCNNNLNMFQEMRLASLLQKPKHGSKAISAIEAFEMATIEGAKTLGIEKEVGSLEAGKKADIVALDLQKFHSAVHYTESDASQVYSSIVYSGQPNNVSHTWVDGKLVYQQSNTDPQGIISEALAQQKKLL